MSKTDFGDCIGCHQPIRPPYLMFVVQRLEQQQGEDARIYSWNEVEVCGDCAAKLTADDLYRAVTADDAEDITA